MSLFSSNSLVFSPPHSAKRLSAVPCSRRGDRRTFSLWAPSSSGQAPPSPRAPFVRTLNFAQSQRYSAGVSPSATIAYREIEVITHEGVGLFDITSQIQDLLGELGATEGFVNALSRHTTTALTINEMEPRLVEDVRQFLAKLVPAGEPYLHNDLHLREAPDNWPGGPDAWREQEPINAHSHLQAMLLGQSETIPVHEGKLALGTWQSVILIELDGTKGRKRTVALQYFGESS
uniref:Secondary thiamine-phosphate synthase enzyme n=1 Tax=Tetraselmis sp. GSL018 TaxID=582737 RepID=A0A061S4K5_9CHLO